MSLPGRYEDRPILIIIESYALKVIGQLSADKDMNMLKVVQHTWGGGEDWMATVRVRLNWQPSVDEVIEQNWAGYQQAGRDQGVTGSAEEFAMMFADAIEADATAN